MIDVSDGLVADSRHLAEESGVCIMLETSAWGFAEPLAEAGLAMGVDPREWMLTGGEDHGLLATFPAHVVVPPPFVIIGSVADAGSSGSAGEFPRVMVDGQRREGLGGHVHFGGLITR
jgi:thiamine-monophosphate kinase